jgi:hypothetical protein
MKFSCKFLVSRVSNRLPPPQLHRPGKHLARLDGLIPQHIAYPNFDPLNLRSTPPASTPKTRGLHLL